MLIFWLESIKASKFGRFVFRNSCFSAAWLESNRRGTCHSERLGTLAQNGLVVQAAHTYGISRCGFPRAVIQYNQRSTHVAKHHTHLVVDYHEVAVYGLYQRHTQGLLQPRVRTIHIEKWDITNTSLQTFTVKRIHARWHHHSWSDYHHSWYLQEWESQELC